MLAHLVQAALVLTVTVTCNLCAESGSVTTRVVCAELRPSARLCAVCVCCRLLMDFFPCYVVFCASSSEWSFLMDPGREAKLTRCPLHHFNGLRLPSWLGCAWLEEQGLFACLCVVH